MSNVVMMPTNREAEMVCDDCQASSKWKEIDIHTAKVKIVRKKLTLVYFVCPNCGKLYRVCLEDRRSGQLAMELDKYREEIKTCGRPHPYKSLAVMIGNKYDQLKEYMKELNDKYQGQFAFADKDGKQVIVYRNE